MTTCENMKQAALERGTQTPVKDWFLICLASETGLRVQEIADLNCGDIRTSDGAGFVIVRHGKNGKPRLVHTRKEFCDKAAEFVAWKQRHGDTAGEDAPLFAARAKRMTKRALQKSYRRTLAKAGIEQRRGVGIHSLRHTYASFLLKASRFNLPLVQKQLGHASVRTTDVYAHVFDPEIRKAVGRLYAP